MDQKVKIKANVVPKLNLSFYQNSVPMICEIKLKMIVSRHNRCPII